MVYGAFSGFDRSPLIIISLRRRVACDFVDLFYEVTLSGFYYLNDYE